MKTLQLTYSLPHLHFIESDNLLLLRIKFETTPDHNWGIWPGGGYSLIWIDGMSGPDFYRPNQFYSSRKNPILQCKFMLFQSLEYHENSRNNYYGVKNQFCLFNSKSFLIEPSFRVTCFKTLPGFRRISLHRPSHIGRTSCRPIYWSIPPGDIVSSGVEYFDHSLKLRAS